MLDSNFEKVIDTTGDKLHHGDKMQAWTKTLPLEEQAEWQRVHLIHEETVQRAIQNGDAKIDAQRKIFWKNDTVHSLYFNIKDPDHRKYLDFWHRYRETLR